MATIEKDWKRDYLYRMFSHRTFSKEKENYILNAIWHKIDCMELQPVTQQYIRRKNGHYALIDLYFPQLNYGIECDEAYHKDNIINDESREIDLRIALSACEEHDIFTLRRVDATQSINIINSRIHEIVNEIRNKIDETGSNMKPWLSPENQMALVKQKRLLRVEDDVAFPSIANVCQCFGKNKDYKIQRCFFHIGNEFMIWCPKLAIEMDDGNKMAASKKGWLNILSKDCITITESNIAEKQLAINIKLYPELPRITFVQSKSLYGETAYRFIGIYKFFKRTIDFQNVYTRVNTQVDLSSFLSCT